MEAVCMCVCVCKCIFLKKYLCNPDDEEGKNTECGVEGERGGIYKNFQRPPLFSCPFMNRSFDWCTVRGKRSERDVRSGRNRKQPLV
jgi:hypothetical protein